MDEDRTARRMLDACERDEQCARRIEDDAVAQAVRARIRVLARQRGLRIRTARLGDAVVVVRLDAAVWRQDAATMRRVLAPPDRAATGR